MREAGNIRPEEPTDVNPAERKAAEWNYFSDHVQKVLELLKPGEVTPAIRNACREAGVSEQDLYDAHKKLEAIFNAYYKSAFPPTEK